MQPLLDAVVDYLPSPLDIPPVVGLDPRKAERVEVERPADDTAPFSALVFKIMTDPFVGQLAFFRVYSGVMRSGDTVLNATKNKSERIGRLLKMHANKREEIKEVYSGDIAAAVGLRSVTTGDTICDEQKPIVLEAMDFPEPVIPLAIEPKTKADQEKLGIGLGKLQAEDPTFRVHTDTDTGQVVISGMGELHLEIIVDRLKREFNVEASVGKPQVAYKETLTPRPRPRGATSGRRAAAASTATSRSASPRASRARASSSRTASSAARSPASSSSRSTRGSGRRWRPACWPATRSTTCGSSSTTARTTRSTRRRWRSRSPARWRSRKRRRRPSRCCSSRSCASRSSSPRSTWATSWATSTRGAAASSRMEARGGTQIVNARVPLSEMFGYATDLRSRTQGRATYTMHFDRYEQAPQSVSEEVIARIMGR